MPDPAMNAEHNPDNLTPEQYGAPEWRLLRKGEILSPGDQYRDDSIGRDFWTDSITGFTVVAQAETYRRRVSPPSPETDATAAELSENKGGDEPCAQTESHPDNGTAHLLTKLEKDSSASNAPVAVQSGDMGQPSAKRVAEEKETLEHYLARHVRIGIIDFSLRASFDGKTNEVIFYIHPNGVDGDTVDFILYGNAVRAVEDHE